MYMDNCDDAFDSENEEIYEIENSVTMKPTFVIIAIDTHPLMFHKREDGSMPFKDCLEACYALADSLILEGGRGKWSQFAIVLARDDSPVLAEFGDSILGTVKLLKEKIYQVPDKQLIDEYQRNGDFDLASFFLICKKLFHDIKSAFYKRTFLYITNDDNPVPDQQKSFTALKEAKTFSGSEIDFQVIPTRLDFNYKIFYNELFHVINDEIHTEEICEDKNGIFQKLTSTIIVKRHQTKVRFYPIVGDTDRFLPCYIFDIAPTPSILPIKVTKEGKMVKRVKNNDVCTYSFHKIPELEHIKLDSLEYDSLLDHKFPKGLTLVYISKKLTEYGYSFGKSYILRQDDKSDLPYFKTIWQMCVNNNRVLVCIRKLKDADKLRYVELIPMNINDQPMFLVKRIPFSSEIDFPQQMTYPNQQHNQKQIEAMKKLVNDLTIDFNFQMCPNLIFQKKQAYIKSKLLEEPMKEIDDSPLITKDVDEKLKEAVKMVKANYILEEEKKRKASGGTSKAKKVK